MENTGLNFLIILIPIIIWILPLLIIIGSSKTSGSEKIAWILAMFFVSWFAWIFYILLAPIKKG